jgi:hypothetical protein
MEHSVVHSDEQRPGLEAPPIGRRERKLQRFKSPGSAQRFLSLHAATYNVFTVARHLTTARTHRLFRAEALATWREAAGVGARPGGEIGLSTPVAQDLTSPAVGLASRPSRSRNAIRSSA